MFFATVGPGASHVGIAIGGDEFVHAPSGAGEVRVERVSSAPLLGYARLLEREGFSDGAAARRSRPVNCADVQIVSRV